MYSIVSREGSRTTWGGISRLGPLTWLFLLCKSPHDLPPFLSRHPTLGRCERGGANSFKHRRTKLVTKHAPAAPVQRFVMLRRLI